MKEFYSVIMKFLGPIKLSTVIFIVICISFLLVSFGPKPKIKGLWYSCSEVGYIEMRISKNKLSYTAKYLKESTDFTYRLKSDTMFILKENDGDNNKIIKSVLSFKGRDTLNMYYPKQKEYWTFYRIGNSANKNLKGKKSKKLFGERSKIYNCPEPKRDSFIYFEF